MIMAIIVILILAAVVFPLAGVARQYRLGTFASAENERSLALAEAGIAAALYEMNNQVDLDRTVADGNAGIGFVKDFVGAGHFEVTIDPAFAGMEGGPYEVTSVGTQGDYRSGIRVALIANGISEQQDNFYQWWAGYPGVVFSNDELYLSGPRDATSYDSTDPSSSETDQGTIRSNHNIHIGYDSSMEIYGDVTPGPGYTVTEYGLPFTEIHGATTPADWEITPPMPEIPDNPHTIPSNPHSIPSTPATNDNATLDPAFYDSATESLVIPDWDTATFPGGTYVLNDIYFGGAGTEITFTGDTTLHVPAGSSFEISTGNYTVQGNLTIVTYGATSASSGWADVNITGDLALHVGSTGSFTTAGTDNVIVGGNFLLNSSGTVTFGEGDEISVTGDAEHWINTGGSLTYADWADYTVGGTLDLVSDGPVSFGGAGTDIAASGDTSYYIDSNGSLTYEVGGDVDTDGTMLIVSKGPVEYKAWSDVDVGADMEIYLDPGASLTYGDVSDLRMDGNFKIISHDAPIDFGTGADLDFSSSDSFFDIFTTSTINGGAWNTMAAGEASPKNLRWVTTSDSDDAIKIGGPRDFYGQLYAPAGKVTVATGSDVYGAVVADRLEQTSWNRFVFDVALQDYWLDFIETGSGETSTPGEVRDSGELPFLITSYTSFFP